MSSIPLTTHRNLARWLSAVSIRIRGNAKKVLLDTNAMSTLLNRKNPTRELFYLGWVPIYHPVNEAELSKWHLLSSYYDYRQRNKFVQPLQPSEMRRAEFDNYDLDRPVKFFHSVGRMTPASISDAIKWGMVVKVEARRKHKRTAATIKNRRFATTPLKAAEFGVVGGLQAMGLVFRGKVDPYRFPSLISESYALFQKYLAPPAPNSKARMTNSNDIYDLFLFYLLPYVDVFITENNNAQIAREIRSVLKKKDALPVKTLEILTLSEFSKML